MDSNNLLEVIKTINKGGPDLWQRVASEFLKYTEKYPPEATPRTLSEEWQRAKDLAAVAAQAGVYVPLYPQDLLEAGGKYYARYADTIREALQDVNPQTVEAVLKDYLKTVTGFADVEAEPEQMAEALAALTPQRAYLLDRYGLYFGLWLRYIRIVEAWKRYNNMTPEELNTILSAEAMVLTADKADAVFYLYNSNNIPAGVNSEVLEKVAAAARQLKQIYEYISTYIVARVSLGASAEQAAQISQPLGGIPPQILTQIAEVSTATAVQQIDGLALELAEGLEDPNKTGADIRAIKKRFNDASTIQVYRKAGLILSNSIYASVEERGKCLPIASLLPQLQDDKIKDLVVGEQILYRALMGVTLLIQDQDKPYKGYYSVKTTITEFSELCGYNNANAEDKAELYKALRVLHNTYIRVKRANGYGQLNVLSVGYIGVKGSEEGKLWINVNELFKAGGEPSKVAYSDLKQLNKGVKGTAQSRFKDMIISVKEHQEEEELLGVIFGYQARLEEAEAIPPTLEGNTPSFEDRDKAVKKVRDYIRKHKGEDRKKILSWFEKYQEEGFITYRRYENNYRKIIYEWKYLKRPKE